MTATEPDGHGGLMHRLIDAWTGRDLDGSVDCYTDPLVVRTGEGQEDLEVPRVEHQEAARTWRQRFPDLTETIEEILVDGDRVMLLTRSTGTLQTDWRGIQPNGEQVAWDAWYLYRVRDGLVAWRAMLMRISRMQAAAGAAWALSVRQDPAFGRPRTAGSRLGSRCHAPCHFAPRLRRGRRSRRASV